jgi:uncharacterized membrane protein
MAVLFALLSALGYGTSDFAAGLVSRRYAAEPTTGMVIAIEVVCTAVGVILFPGHGPRPAALEWGALSGLGGGVGTLALYRGLSAGAMAIVGTVSAVLAAVVPVLVGLALGNHLSVGAATGIAIAVPAIALVSWQPGQARGSGRGGTFYGVIAGLGFALLFIGLDRAGTRSGAWPLLPGQSVGLLVVFPTALRGVRRAGRPALRDAALMLVCGVLGTVAALLFLNATGHGELSIVAVVTALYPAFTVLLARALLSERWSRPQALGLVVAAASIVLVSLS